jgi:hypothetical protein
MPSQLDLDQGGTFRQTHNVYLGPSIGWVPAPTPVGVILPVITGGTTTVLPGNTLVTVNFNGAVTIQLPSAKASLAGAGANPGTFVQIPLTVVDVGGFAIAHPITILPFGAETIDGLVSISISSNYGAYVLKPNTTTGGWTLMQ